MYKILLVEDDSTITAVLKRTLENGDMRRRLFPTSVMWKKNLSVIRRIWFCLIYPCPF